jgi:hypothetical protein
MMTRHILDVIKENQMNQPPEPTEKAQIAIMFTYGAQNIVRYSTTKKAEKEYKGLLDALAGYRKKGFDHNLALHTLNGDMFVTTFDLSSIIAVSYVDIAKRVKFIPYAG